MGNTIFIKDRRVCVRPLRSRLEADSKTKTSYNWSWVVEVLQEW